VVAVSLIVGFVKMGGIDETPRQHRRAILRRIRRWRAC